MKLFPIRHGGHLLVHGGMVSGAGYLLRIVARLIVALLAARLFGASLFGAFVVAIAVTEAAATASGLSTKWMLFKWLDSNAKDGVRPPGHVLLDAAILVGAASVLFSLLILAIAYGSSEIAPNTRFVLTLLVPAVTLQALLDLMLAATRWTHVMRFDFVAKSVIQPFASIAFAGVVYLAGAGAATLALAYVAGTLLAFLYAAGSAQRRLGGFELTRYRVRPRNLGRKLRSALPTTVPDVVDSLFARADIYLVTLLLGEVSAGIYGVARQVSMPVRQTRQAFDGMLVPLVSKTLAVKGAAGAADATMAVSRLILLIQAPVVILLAAGAPALLSLTGEVYSAALGAALLLAAAEWIQGAFGIGELVLVLSRPRLAIALTASCMGIAILCAFLFAPAFGITGIGLAVLVSYLARSLGRAAILRTVYSEPPSPGFWLVPAACAAAGIGVVAAFHARGAVGTNLLAAMAAVAGLAIYALAIGAWRATSRVRLLPDGFAVELEEANGPSRE
jgi:O-antigen/teichoic acid export membrane protein